MDEPTDVDWNFSDEVLEDWGNRFMNLRLEITSQEDTKHMNTRQVTGLAVLATVRQVLEWILEADNPASESDSQEPTAAPE